MKIWLLVGFILSAFVLSKVYAYKRFLRDSVLFTHHKKLLIALLGVVFLGEIGFFILAKEQNFNHLTYRVLGTFIVIGYCLFAACVIGDIARSVARIFSTKITKRTKILQSSQSSSPNTNQINQGRREFFKILLDLGIVVLFFCFYFQKLQKRLQCATYQRSAHTLTRTKIAKNYRYDFRCAYRQGVRRVVFKRHC